jgi:hypothetical protein
MADGNTLLTTAQITYESAAVLMNNLVFAGKIDRQYSDEFAVAGAKIGDQIHIRKPPRFVVTDGPVVTPQNIVETYVTLTLNYQKTLALNYTGKDLALSIDNFRDRIIKPAAVELANEVDRQVLADVYRQVYNFKGSPGTPPNDSAIFLDMKARMLDEATPDDDIWCACITPRTQASMVKALQGLFNDQARIAEQYTRGAMGTALGFDWYVDQNMPAHVVGALGGTPLVSGGGQTGSSLLTSGWTATTGAVRRGDVINLANVFAVNPKHRRSTGELRDFVVLADATADGSGNMTISIAPPIVPPDSLGNVVQFQTVNASPAPNAPITVKGGANTNTPQNICFHPKFASLGFADLPLPKRGEAYRVQDEDLGISMRVWEDSNWLTDTHGVRMDVLFGVVVVYSEWAGRIAA